MTYLLLQTFLLLLASYFLGAFVACLVKSAFFSPAVEAPAQYAGVQDVDGTMRPPIATKRYRPSSSVFVTVPCASPEATTS